MLTLLYHNILKEAATELPVAAHQVSVPDFQRQINSVREHLLDPREVHEQLMQGKKPRGVLVTFDDGATGILDAARILAEMGAVGVAFVCPGAVTNGLWFYRLADTLVRASVERLQWREFDLRLTTALERHNAYYALFAQLFDSPGRVRDSWLEEIVAAALPSSTKPHVALTTLNMEEVRRVADTGGMIFANHSWSHPNLIKLSPTELRFEIEAAQHWLDSARLPVLPWFAFPVGVHNAIVRKMVAELCPVAFGVTASESKVLPRLGIYRADANRIRFALKTAWGGWLPSMLHMWRGPGSSAFQT